MEVQAFKPGSNITIMNTLSSRRKDNEGHYREILTLVYKDADTGLKYKEEYVDPEKKYYIVKPDKHVDYNRLFAPREDLEEVSCINREIEKDIADRTGNRRWYKEQIAANNRAEISRIHTHPDIFGSDIHIEDYYRYEFAKTYKNEPCKITKSFLDIEADIEHMIGDFPQLGECPVNAITLILQEQKKGYTFLLEDPTNPQIEEFKQQVIDKSIFKELKTFIKTQIDGANNPGLSDKYGVNDIDFSFLFYKHEDEINLIRDLFKAINAYKPDFVLAWNMSFDIPYLIERCRVLGYDPEKIICHPDFKLPLCEYFVDERMKNEFAERGDFALISSYSTYLDQMIQYASRRKSQSKPLSYGLDYTGETVAKVHKYDYKHITTDIAQLPRKSYKTFVFYNIMDVIVQWCIENRTQDVDYVFSKALMNNTRYPKVHRQTIYLFNRGKKEFEKSGLILGNNANKFNEKPARKFPGAFVADMERIKNTSRLRINGIPVNVFELLDDFDYSSLYPSIYRQFNLAANTQIGMIIIKDQVMPYENRQHDDAYSRSGQFLEDMQSHVWLEFATRWFHVGSFMDIINDTKELFCTIILPQRGLRYYESDGTIDPMFIPDNEAGKHMATDPMIFDCDPRFAEVQGCKPIIKPYVPFDIERANKWREYATANINQSFR